MARLTHGALRHAFQMKEVGVREEFRSRVNPGRKWIGEQHGNCSRDELFVSRPSLLTEDCFTPFKNAAQVITGRSCNAKYTRGGGGHKEER
ncbi:membrane-bound complement regulatory protein [Microcella alkaliphila]|uniref:Membrane-bound complement regulatory protein n=1 Tax=Microcella alkaliphila TaxID=279828 RepID=A0A0U4WVE6_9MICO|nr:membrane-bound complement regulatory protein [Microcella alkaliphila]